MVISDSPCSPTLHWIRDLNLKPEDQRQLQETKQLNDRIVMAAGKVLKSQFPEFPKPQPTLYTQTLHKLHRAEEGSLFFCNFNNHWTFSHLSQGQVFHYDSLPTKVIASELLKQLVTLYAHTSNGTELQISHKYRFSEGAQTVSCVCFSWEMIQLPLFITRRP